MNRKEMMQKLLYKCDIYFEDSLISKELLLQTYYKFLANTFDESEHNVGVILHTGSICFDVITVMSVAISTLVLNEQKAIDLIESLEKDDLVIYKNKRYRYGGFGSPFNYQSSDVNTHILLLQDNNAKTWIPRKNKNLIKPYFGTAKSLDGRGIRKNTNKRLDFISSTFDIPEKDIPSITNVSSIIVMNRDLADRIFNGLKIKYNGNCYIKLLDFVIASYFTEHDEYPYSGNPGKNEPNLMITNKVSIARDLIFNRKENKIVGVTTLGYDSISKGRTELPELIHRRSLQYVYTSFPIDSGDYTSLINEYSDTKVFSCTKDFLLSYSLPTKELNMFTLELDKRVENIIYNQLNIFTSISNDDMKDFYTIKRALNSLKNSNYTGYNKDFFIIQSYSLINLFITAVFPLQHLESLIESNVLDVISPQKRISEIKEIATKFTSSDLELTNKVINLLEKTYNKILYTNNKEPLLKDFLERNKNMRILIVVPKSYYKDILLDDYFYKHMSLLGNLEFTTANSFDFTKNYDEIIVLGDYKGKKFDPYNCKSSANINIFVYDFEINIVNYKNRQAKAIEENYNEKSFFVIQRDEKNRSNYEDDYNNAAYETYEELEITSRALQSYIYRLNELIARNIANKSMNEHSGSSLAEISMIGTFTDGQIILFSKGYKALVFDHVNENVNELNIDNLAQGDVLVFTRNNDYTKNIIDNILENLLGKNLLSKEIEVAVYKSEYWKDALKTYMEKNKLSYKELSDRLLMYGSKRHEVTLRSWLDKDSRIIGPTDQGIFDSIARMTKDIELLKDPKSYHDACRIVRIKRIEILKLVGEAIIKKISGDTKGTDSIFEVVFSNVDKLAYMMELESIKSVEENFFAPFTMANRPISV